MQSIAENVRPKTTEEYLSVAEVAERLRLSPKRIRNLMSAGIFKAGYHFYRPRGIAPRFKWSRVVEWLEGCEAERIEPIPMARSGRESTLVARRATEIFDPNSDAE